jgi:hypothetical protein
MSVRGNGAGALAEKAVASYMPNVRQEPVPAFVDARGRLYMPTTEAAPERQAAKAKATAFLQAALAGAPVPAAEVGRMAHEHGLTAKAVRSAREALNVRIARVGFGPGSRSLWSLLPRGDIDAQPIPSEEGRLKTKDGHEIIGLAADAACDYCGGRDGTVYLVRNPFEDGRSEPLHEDCAAAWFEWLGKRGVHGQV